MNRNMKIEELIKVLEKFPQDKHSCNGLAKVTSPSLNPLLQFWLRMTIIHI